MESEGGQRVLEHLIAVGCVLHPVLEKVEVVVLIEITEPGAGDQSISSANERTPHLDRDLRIISRLVLFLFLPFLQIFDHKIFFFSFAMAPVISISFGQVSTQLKIVWHL